MATENGPQFLRHAPYFPVADVEQSSAYYTTVLGFGETL